MKGEEEQGNTEERRRWERKKNKRGWIDGGT